jgi:nucleotide-binding universal stress UspA family protein
VPPPPSASDREAQLGLRHSTVGIRRKFTDALVPCLAYLSGMTDVTDTSDARATQSERAERAREFPSVFADVLCAVDGSPGGFSAVEQAASLIGPGGHMTLLAVTSFRSSGAYRSPAIGPLRTKEILDRAVQIADDARVTTTVDVDPATPPADVILEWAARHDLLAMGAPTTPWLGGMLGGGPTAAALGSLITPLLVARSAQAAGIPAGPILVASDGLEGSDQLVEFATRLAQAQGAGAHLLHATGHGSKRRHHRIAEQAQRLERDLGKAGDARIEAGRAQAMIVESAREVDSPLVVMSSRRRHGPRTIGSVSRRVVHNAACSVLLVPPEHLQA